MTEERTKWHDKAQTHDWKFVKTKTIIGSNLQYSFDDYICTTCGLEWYTDSDTPKMCDYSCSEYLMEEVLT